MIEMQCPAGPATDGASAEPKNQPPKNSRNAVDLQAAAQAIGNALIAEPRPDARDLSLVLRRQLDVPDLTYTGAAVAWAMPPRTAARLAGAIHHDAIASMHKPADQIGATAEIEAERQRRAWARWCRQTQGGRKRCSAKN